MIDANVICKELDYAGANTKKVKVNKDADPSMKIHINKLECDPGDYFWHCSHYDFNRPICGHNEDIKVSCSPGKLPSEHHCAIHVPRVTPAPSTKLTLLWPVAMAIYVNM